MAAGRTEKRVNGEKVIDIDRKFCIAPMMVLMESCTKSIG
jgi:hypothetical protein